MITRSSTRAFQRLYSTKNSAEKAFTQRLQELESQYPDRNDPLFTRPKSIIDSNERLSKLEKELDQRKFELENQVSIQATKVPVYADRAARETAHSAPWTGKETTVGANLRMLQDGHRPSRSMREAQKMGRARDKVLDLKMAKLGESSTTTPNEDEQFRMLYTEKFTPIGSFDKIKTLADARIEDAYKRGEFENIPRGKKLDTSVGAYVDRTEHHLNNILVKQNLSPPWVEKQGTVNSEITGFRKELKEKWRTHIDLFYRGDHGNLKKEFESKWAAMLDARVTLANNVIRTYNLQAPLSTQKLYLLRDQELQRCYGENDVDEVRHQIKTQNQQREEQARINEEEERKKRRLFKFWNW